jgi:peptidoglycan hydrolase-like protein with peptidoglycan-binding domain
MSKLLFPQPYLPVGSKGPAVVVLQLLLLALGLNPQILPDGDYGEETQAGVKKLQDSVGIETDGDFGPETRAKLLEETGVDVNIIPALDGETLIPDVG